MKLNFPLDKFDTYLDDDMLLLAENLLSVQPLQPLEVEKNLYIVRFTEGVETEVQLGGTKVKMVSCDCNEYSKNNICRHVTALLWTLNDRRKSKIEEKKAAQALQKAAVELPTRITIPNILKRIEPTQLIEFIADYARTDKQFALALKTRFAGDLAPTGDLEEHYKTLIDNALRSMKNAKGKITPKGWLQVFTMIDELKQKAENHLKNGELHASFAILKIALPLVHRFFRTSDSPKVKLEKRQSQMVEILRGFEEIKMSPELTQTLWDFTINEWTQNTRHPFSERLFDRLLKHADTDIKINHLLQLIDNQAYINRNFIEARDRLLTQKIQLLQKSGRVEEASQLILAAVENPDVLYFAVENALSNDDLTLAKSLSMNGLDIFKTSNAVTERLETYLLDIAERQQNQIDILDFAERRFVKTLDFSFYEKMKAIGMSSNKINAIIQNIENQPFRLDKRNVLAAIYMREQMFDKLTTLIQELQSLELLKRYGVDLWIHDPKASINLHEKIIYEYLLSHLGRPPAQRIRQLLETHLQRDSIDLVNHLKNTFIQAFPERFSLKEELTLMSEEWERQLKIKNIT